MNAFDPKDDRRVIPRWRDFANTVGAAELQPLPIRVASKFNEAQEVMKRKQSEWVNNKGPAFASDLVGSAITFGLESDAIDAAKYILEHEKEVSGAVSNLAISLLIRCGARGYETPSTSGTEGRDEHRRRIRDLRIRARLDPRNPIVQVDIARIYTNLGMHKQAQRAIEVALALAPISRFVVRSATRFLVHIGETDRALSVVRTSPVLEKDPWLLSAEIAVSSVAGRRSKLVKHARAMVEHKRYAPDQITEVASALASTELEEGSTRQSKKLFSLSLESPTDNAVAQAEWASRKANISLIEPRHLEIARTFEARALDSFNDGKIDETYRHSMAWLMDEPFSTRPVGLAAYVASVGLEDYSAAVRVAEAGVAANPSHQGLRSALIYALIMSGRLDRAAKEFTHVEFAKASDLEKVLLTATNGLHKFRLGNQSVGRQLYQQAIDIAKSAKLSQLRAVAYAYWAREELFADSSDAVSVYTRAREEVDALPKLTAFNLVRGMLEKAKKPQQLDKRIRNNK